MSLSLSTPTSFWTEGNGVCSRTPAASSLINVISCPIPSVALLMRPMLMSAFWFFLKTKKSIRMSSKSSPMRDTCGKGGAYKQRRWAEFTMTG
eukprot:7384459-Prymnesium_polylepis.1